MTLLLDDEVQRRFDLLRADRFPPERNHLVAYVTPFRALPGEQVDVVRAELAAAADREAFDEASRVLGGDESAGAGAHTGAVGDHRVIRRPPPAAGSDRR